MIKIGIKVKSWRKRMEKIINEIKQTEIIYHEFYCDECKEYVGRSRELDDGYYERMLCTVPCIEFNGDNYYPKARYLCEECYDKYVKETKKKLKEMGFDVFNGLVF